MECFSEIGNRFANSVDPDQTVLISRSDCVAAQADLDLKYSVIVT
jgi:hypothetical protein